MRVEFEFDKQKVEAHGYTMKRIYDTVKRAFAAQNLRCIFGGEVLAFADNGGKEDFSHMWILINRIVNTDWFLPFATATTTADTRTCYLKPGC